MRERFVVAVAPGVYSLVVFMAAGEKIGVLNHRVNRQTVVLSGVCALNERSHSVRAVFVVEHRAEFTEIGVKYSYSVALLRILKLNKLNA